MLQPRYNLLKSRVLSCLVDGLSQTQIAKKLGASRMTIFRYTRELEREGGIRKVCKCPALYEKLDLSKPNVTSGWSGMMSGVKVVTKEEKISPLLPHMFGASFRIERQPCRWVGGYRHWARNWSYYVWSFGDFTVLAYPRKVVFWLLVPSGATVEERIRLGLLALHAKAREFEASQGCVLVSQGVLLQPVEWAAADVGLSKALNAFLNLRVEPKVIAGSLWKFDASHKPFAEVGQAPGGTVEAPTENAKRFEWLLLELPSMIKGLSEAVGSLMELKKEPKLDGERREVG